MRPEVRREVKARHRDLRIICLETIIESMGVDKLIKGNSIEGEEEVGWSLGGIPIIGRCDLDENPVKETGKEL